MSAEIYYDLTVPQFSKMLSNLDLILAKSITFAESKKIEVDVLLHSRLAPDQFNLARQIQIACDMAKICVAKITQKEAPIHDDSLVSLPQLRNRIQETIQFINSASKSDFSKVSEVRVTTPRWENKYLMGHEYLIHHSLPNFYFHMTAAYQILRHNGLEIGKKDYLGPIPFRT